MNLHSTILDLDGVREAKRGEEMNNLHSTILDLDEDGVPMMNFHETDLHSTILDLDPAAKTIDASFVAIYIPLF